MKGFYGFAYAGFNGTDWIYSDVWQSSEYLSFSFRLRSVSRGLQVRVAPKPFRMRHVTLKTNARRATTIESFHGSYPDKTFLLSYAAVRRVRGSGRGVVI